jgi:hypothetical protein
MTGLSDMLFAGLLLQRRDRQGRRSSPFAPLGFDHDDLRAARERARRRS